jgi:hypothetical protein
VRIPVVETNEVSMIKEKAAIFGKRMTEITPACLMMMVQGNVTAITIGHWIKALETGALAGIALVILSFAGKSLQNNKYSVAGMTGFMTIIADRLSHPSHFWGANGEAIATGIAASMLCLVMSRVWGKK